MLSDLLLRVCGVSGIVFKQETFVLNRPEVLRGRTDWRNYLRPFSSAAGAAATLYEWCVLLRAPLVLPDQC